MNKFKQNKVMFFLVFLSFFYENFLKTKTQTVEATQNLTEEDKKCVQEPEILCKEIVLKEV